MYEIHIDNDGDARENITFQFRVDNDLGGNGRGLKVPVGNGDRPPRVAVPLKNIGSVVAGSDNADTLNFRESYTLRIARGDRRSKTSAITNAANGTERFGKPYDFVGTKTFGSVAEYETYARQFVYHTTIPGCSKPGRVFVGQRDEPFVRRSRPRVRSLDFGHGCRADRRRGAARSQRPFPGGIKQDNANDIISDKNVTTLALEVHKSCLVGSGNGVIGVWTSASLPQVRVVNPKPTFDLPEINAGAYTQVSRLGMPLVNELVIGLPDKDRFSATASRRMTVSSRGT